MLLPPGELRELAHYQIVRLLGAGGMGKVYQAEDLKLQRTVALKVMLPDMASLTDRERFLREARAMAAVHSDHVVTIYEVGQADDTPYLAMEFLQGQSLASWMKTKPVLHAGDILRIGQQIATGLAAAQMRGLIHRDIKPANIWLEIRSEERGARTEENPAATPQVDMVAPFFRVKILDFGLARPANQKSGLSVTGDVVGTPSYMSPEQARGKPVDFRTDLFSLGVVLYELCAQQLPFRGDSVTAVLTALAVDQPSPIRELNPNIPPVLDDLVMQLLEKDPERRPPSAALVADRLRAIAVPLASTSVSVPGPTNDAAQAPTLGPGAFSNTLPNVEPRSRPAPPTVRWRRLLAGGVAAGVVCLVALGWWALAPGPNELPAPAIPAPAGPPIHLGILYSRTGTMAISERAILQGALLAVSEINDNGGVLGRPLQPVIEDGQSDENVFASKAGKLITQDKVSALFGTWTSASRKAVKAVVEKHDQLLFYPVSYEGMEQSPNIVYGGSVPNQQILPALKWCYGFLNKKRWFLTGLDSVYSRAAHAVIRDEAKTLGNQIVGEGLLLENDGDVAGLIREITEAKPDLIINTIKGDTNIALFRGLRRAGLMPPEVPTLSFAISEEELSSLTASDVQGQYAAGNYFQSIDLPRNREFLQRAHKRFDSERNVSDPMQTMYTLVHLWAQTAQAAGSTEAPAVRQRIKGQQYDSPEGLVTIDSRTQHTTQVSRVGVINEQGHFIEVYASPQPVLPEPFPTSRPRPAWEQFLNDLHEQWGGRWHNPGPR